MCSLPQVVQRAKLSAINTDVDSAVRSLFSVKDYFVTEDGAAEYSVDYGARSGPNFLKLLKLLKATTRRSYTATRATRPWSSSRTSRRQNKSRP
jgi:hypothetical protein